MGLLTKIGYSSGSITAALPQYAIQTYLFFHYAVNLHMNEFWLASALTLWSIWNAVNDPIFGYLSDKTRTRWGRRIPWIAVFAIPLALSTFLVFGPPGDALSIGDFNLFIWLTLSIIFYDTCYTIVVLNWTALFPEMYASNEERSQVSVIRQIFSIFGLIIGTAAPAILAAMIGWPIVGLAIGITSSLFAFLSLSGSREAEEFRKEETLPLLKGMKHTFTNKAFVIFVLYNFCVQYVIAVVIGALPFYATYILGNDVTLLFLMLFLVALPVFFVWNKMNVIKGPRTTSIVTMLWVGVVLLAMMFVPDFTTALIIIAIAGAGVGGFMIQPDILIAFAIDADEVETGKRREGAYFGFNAFIMRFAVVVQAWTYAVLLYSSGFDENLATQPADALFGLRLLVSIIPFIAIVIGAFIISKYPFHGEKLNELQKKIEGLRD
ncbi:MAG: MFS transporter [Candidatus Thorarchaeota archaeon]